MFGYLHTTATCPQFVICLGVAMVHSPVASAMPIAMLETVGTSSQRLDYINSSVHRLGAQPADYVALVSRRRRLHPRRIPWLREKFAAIVYSAIGAVRASEPADLEQADVIAAANAYKLGGGFNQQWKGSGTPREIRFGGQKLLGKGQGTYCCGFTFTVAMDVAVQRKLLDKKSFAQLRKFQKDWYGVSTDSKETLCVHAVEALGVGIAVEHSAAKMGDMVQFWRSNGSGHSVLFLNWVESNGKVVGLRYRSSQTATDGIGDRVEYFSDSTSDKDGIERARTYVCRLNPSSN